MALKSVGTSAYFRAIDALPGLATSAGALLIEGWWKLATAEAGASRGLFSLSQSTNNSQHQMCCEIHSNNNAYTEILSNATTVVNDASNTTLATLWDVWTHDCLIVAGPHDGSSRAWERRINDAIWDSGSFTSQNFTADLDTLYVGRTINFGAGSGSDKVAYVGVGAYASVAAARTACTASQTAAPSAVSGMAYAYDLIADGNADLGGVNLSAVGSPTFDADAPALGGGGGGGGTVIVTSSWCGHRESARDHARRLSIGWSRAMDLRRAA